MDFVNTKEAKLRVIVTGSPRSGTSFLSGLVHRMGYSVGSDAHIKAADEHNKYGYFEHVKLMEISIALLGNLGADFHMNIPDLKSGWSRNWIKEKEQIGRIIAQEGIELYKCNRLMILADLYVDLFPEAQWIRISRSTEGAYRSRFGEELGFDDWVKITENREQAWNRTLASKNALEVDYDSMMGSREISLRKIADFLDIRLNTRLREKCLDFFRPSQESSLRHRTG